MYFGIDVSPFLKGKSILIDFYTVYTPMNEMVWKASCCISLFCRYVALINGICIR